MTYTIELTEKEIEALQIALCAERLRLGESVDHLMDHNKTGINTKAINSKKQRMEDCDRLFDKLYNANH